jgi:hypothetical protein
MKSSGKIGFEKALVGEGGKVAFLFSFGIALCLFGLSRDSFQDILSGLWRILIEPDYLISDYMDVGGMGAAFVNSGLLTVLFTSILVFLRVHIRGISIAAVFTVAGFAFFGKNLLNVWFIVAGVWLYARSQKEPFLKFIYIAFFGTALAPLVSQLMFGFHFPPYLRIFLGAAAGLSAGFLLPPLAAAFLSVHHGYNLYNVGFTAGMVGTLYVSVFRSHGFITASRIIWSTGHNGLLFPVCAAFFLFLAAAGLLLGGGKSPGALRSLWRHSGRLLADFVDMFDFPATLINMGLTGLAATAYLYFSGGDFNGPTLGGLLTIAGFSAMGKTPLNITPILLGVMLGSVTKDWSLTDPPIQLAALFGTTLAPIAGEFGWIAGVLAGYIHSSVVLNVGVLHAGFNLYNNGFAGGIVAAILVPLIEAFRGREKR